MNRNVTIGIGVAVVAVCIVIIVLVLRNKSAEYYPQTSSFNVLYTDSNGNMGSTSDLGLEYLTVMNNISSPTITDLQTKITNLQTKVESLETQMNSNKTELTNQITTNKTELQTQITNNKTSLQNQITTNSQKLEYISVDGKTITVDGTIKIKDGKLELTSASGSYNIQSVGNALRFVGSGPGLYGWVDLRTWTNTGRAIDW